MAINEKIISRVSKAMIRELKKQRTKKYPATGVLTRAALYRKEYDLIEVVKHELRR